MFYDIPNRNTNANYMKRNIRLYVQDEVQQNCKIQLSMEQSHYLLNVMRCTNDSQIKVFNEKHGEWIAIVENYKKHCYVTPINQLQVLHSNHSKSLILCFAPTKKHSEFVIEKATEMSVNGIMPIICDRSIVKNVNTERYRKIIIEAIEQSQQISLPHLFDITHLKNVFKNIHEKYKNRSQVFVICDVNSNSYVTPSKLNLTQYEIITLIIGPEGGLSEQDRQVIQEHFQEVIYLKIGSSVMRAETATITAVALCNLAMNRYD